MNISAEQPKIVVVGSSSVDLVLNTEALPKPGETVMATKSESFFGGKGANQAVASARLGASVYFIGCVGEDPAGQQIMRHLMDEGVNVGFVRESEDAATGRAYVTASGGQNEIIVVPAANAMLRPSDVNVAEKLFHTADLVLVQLEIPMDVVEKVYHLASQNHKKLGIYASPGKALPAEMIDFASFIVVKKNDVSAVFGPADVEAVLRRYPNKVFVRAENNQTLFCNGAHMETIGEEVSSEHKMGMGDAFTAGYAVALCHRNPVGECVSFGNEVSRRVSQKRGSQTSLPFIKDFY